MRPIVIKSHERPLAQVRYNQEGDLLFTCARDGACPVAVFLAESGERIGTYMGHTGAVLTIDLTRNASWLLTAGQDSSVRVYDVEHGEELHSWDTHQPARACAFAKGDPRLAVYTTDPFATTAPSMRFVRISEVPQDSGEHPILHIDIPREERVTRVAFTDCDSTVVATCEDGALRRFDVETGQVISQESIHTGPIMDLQVSPDGTHAITASKDKTAKIIDMATLNVLRTFKHNKPVNSAAMSIREHVALVGGQEAADVTTTADAAGGFETHFFHKIFEDEFGKVKGHFGPVNSVAISPDGHSFVTGGEDGFVRLQHFDMDYLAENFIVEP